MYDYSTTSEKFYSLLLTIRIGDLRLQALCSYATFKDYNLAKRCLYLFAGLPFNEEGLLSACVYETPTISGGNSIGAFFSCYLALCKSLTQISSRLLHSIRSCGTGLCQSYE